MQDIDKQPFKNEELSVGYIHRLKRDDLIAELKKYGLNTFVTVKEGRTLLRNFHSTNKNKLRNDSFEMDEIESVCFVCDNNISSESWKYKLLETASKKRNVPVADLIKQLVGNEFAVLVGERDVVCSSCMNLLNLMDTLTAQLKLVQSTLSKHLYSKYNLESDSTKVDYDDSVPEVTEPLHKCGTCNFKTKYEKEYNIHIRSHKSYDNSFNINFNYEKSVKAPQKAKSKKTPASKFQASTKKRKPKNTSKQKKTKIVFQCSVCNEIFPNEASIKFHAKKDHGNDNIVVSEESEYEDIQTLESSDEEQPVTNKNKSKQIKPKDNSLDFLEDWIDDEDGVKYAEKTEESPIKAKSHHDEEEDSSLEEEEQTSKPTCVFCKATFLSFESVQDHIKINHRNRTSNSSKGLKTTPPVESFEIDSTTDILENKTSIKSSRKCYISKVKSYKCNFCGIKKVSLKFIKRHVENHKRKLGLQCRLCGATFKTIVSFKVHRYRCHKVASIKKKCNQCKIIFVDTTQLKTHIKKVHCKPDSLKMKGKTKREDHKLGSGHSLRKVVDTKSKKADNKSPQISKSSDQDIRSSEVSSTSFENGVNLNSSRRQKYICSLCNFISNSDLEMRGHLKKHDIEGNEHSGKMLTSVNKRNSKGNPKLKCDECGIYVSESRQLVNHMNRHKANTCHELGICFYCNKLFLEKDLLTIHMNLTHNYKQNPKCTICGQVYAHSKDLKLHFLRNHFSAKTENLIKKVSEQSFNKALHSNAEDNDVYSKVFKELQDLTGEGNEDMSVDIPKLSFRFSCPLCSFSDFDKNVENHLSSHKENYCNICKTLFVTEDAIKHIENHSIEFQNKACPDCKGTFHDDLHLQSHTLRIHSAVKRSHKCSMCEQSFYSIKGLSIHKQTMHGTSSKKVLSCTKCKMNFYTEKEYETHVEFAHREVLNCKYCDKTLTNVTKLVLHEKNHLKQIKKVYKCNVCGKVLKTLPALKIHKTIHNHIPLQCEICNQSFKSFCTLREHSAKHSDTQEKRFFCSVCDKGFYFYDSHYRHRRTHLDPLLFKCNACGERFHSKLKCVEHKDTCSASTKCSKCSTFYSTSAGSKSHVCLETDK